MRLETLEHVQRIQDKLERLRRRDTGCEVFGSKLHRYRLNSCLSSDELESIEEQHQIVFPEEYRLFLQYIGNGGAGPYYGIYSLEQSLDETYWDLVCDFGDVDKPRSLLPSYLQRPFVPPTSVGQTEEQRTSGFFGLLRIAHQGCDGYCYLVVSGQERGNIWQDWANEWLCPEYGGTGRKSIPQDVWRYLDGRRNRLFVDSLLSPAYPHRLTFFQWYEDWLDTALA